MLQRLFTPLQKMTRGGIAGLIAVLAVAGVVVFFAAARWVNTSPSQCATCHPQLTAMWERSQGHPSDRVTCHECHAGHAEPPASLNVGAVVRDQVVPEKYLSADARVESRCEGCHDGMRGAGTGLDLIVGKERLKGVANRLADGALAGRDVLLPSALVAGGGDVDGNTLLGNVVRKLRDDEWLAAFTADGGGAVDGVREPLAFSGKSLRWARISEAKVREGVVARVRSRLTLYKGGLGTLHRGLASLLALLPTDLPDGTEPAAGVADQARGVLEDMSRGLKAADRARTALIRELGEMDGGIFDPDGLAKALRGVPRALKGGQWGAAREGVVNAHEILEGAGDGFDQDAVDARAQERGGELTRVLQAKLTGLKEAFAAVLEDLPSDEKPAMAGRAELRGAVVQMGSPLEGALPAALPADPRTVVEAAATAVRSLGVSLAAASNLGWSDFSLREGHVTALAERFEALEKSFRAQERAAPDGPAVRRGLEQALRSLRAAEIADGLHLVFGAVPTAPEGWLAVPLRQIVGQAVDALLVLEADLEKRSVIKVNHKVHFQLRDDPASGRAVELGCLDCHRNIAHDKAQLETFRPRMASCFVGGCHRKDRNKDNCRRCHYQQMSELTESGEPTAPTH
ncbi:MAG TPA: hypothetical protein VK997_02350 [Deferrisomatales bacterium]|nr:hypothetical protein [Deferrisomatales bacterium]